mmetsp:Transcript_8388/g.10932  ORF Transcript_8388/g.10932 Transcript_8388/m.10932 type:complete len:93 (-) Transcript_8388:680-958(-)
MRFSDGLTVAEHKTCAHFKSPILFYGVIVWQTLGRASQRSGIGKNHSDASDFSIGYRQTEIRFMCSLRRSIKRHNGDLLYLYYNLQIVLNSS